MEKFNMTKNLLNLFLFILILCLPVYAQEAPDTNSIKDWSVHFQETTISQSHPAFSAQYSGTNSLSPNAETATSLTSTLFLGRRLWENSEAYFNVELAGGQGLSGSTGVAGFPNGEVYRVGTSTPSFNLVRFFIKQIFPLSSEYNPVADGENQVQTKKPDTYISLSAGRFSMIDFFDNNKFSNDPRTQFINWSLMDNGAWDYPADTKGYTTGLVGEYIMPEWAFRISTAMVAKSANGMDMEYNFRNDHSETFEVEHDYSLSGQPGAVRLLTFLTHADMGNYESAIQLPAGDINIIDTREQGRTKYGFGVNAEQNLTDNIGLFLRFGWNDGKNESWMFTEIDQTTSAGLSFDGSLWSRKDDNAGIAFVINQISKDHQAYLEAGGYGFIIGDGNLNYSPESILEAFYSLKVFEFLYASPDYQFILNPAYNSDRGPVNVFSIRFHVEI
jgi:high affinity Mn2+ porin